MDEDHWEQSIFVVKDFRVLGVYVGKDRRGLSGIAAIKYRIFVLSKSIRGYIVGSGLFGINYVVKSVSLGKYN